MLKVEHEHSSQNNSGSTMLGDVLAEKKGNTRTEASFQFWDFPLDMKVREEAPARASQEIRAEFDRIVSAGAIASEDTAGSPLLVIVGFDFGTSSTKVIVRLPGEAGEPTVAIPAPDHCRSENHPYLWQTVLWVRENGEFICYPQQGANLLRALKQGVMGKNLEPPANGVPRVEATVGYLTYVIRYVRGWLIRNRSDLLHRRSVNWLVNLGLPAADYDNRTLVCAYRKAAAAALMLADSGEAISVEATRTFLLDERVKDAALSPKSAEELGIVVVPEVAAAATPFAKSTGSVPGLYLMVDVGAMTLDACTFRLVQRQGGENKYPLLSAAVRPLGVEAFHWFQAQGRTEEEFREQCNRSLYQVTWYTKHHLDPNAEGFKPGNALPVFLTGGGSRNDLHRSIVDALGPWLQQHTRNEGIRLIDIPTSASIDLPEPLNDLNRLAVAWGLSYPREEIGEIKSMSNIRSIEPPPRRNFTERFVSKDQV